MLFVLGHLLWIHGHESLDSVINIHIEIIDFLLDVSSRSVAVDIGGGHVSEHLELFAFMSQFQHLHAAEIVDPQGIL